MKIAVTGHEGRLGSELVRRGCIPIGKDITNRYELFNGIQVINPDVVINCAAITDVDYCEDLNGFEKAIQINYKGVVNLRDVFDGLLVQMSTDYVFDGKHGPYDEKTQYSAPVNFYGMTKQGAETIISTSPKPYYIIRTTCLYDAHIRKDFVSSILSHLETTNEGVDVAKNLYGNPTYIPHLAEGILKLLELKPIPTIINIASRDAISRYEFALMIAHVFDYDAKRVLPSTQSFGVAKRPAKAGLKVNLAEKLGIPLYTAVEGLKALKDKLNEKD